MKTLRLALLLVLLLSSSELFADNQQEIIPVDSSIYGALTSLYLEAGLAPPFQSLPYSVDEAQRALDRVPRSSLSPAGRRTYDYVESALRHKAGYHEGKDLQFSAKTTVTLAGYEQSNKSAQGATSEPEWVRRPPLVNIPLELWLWKDLYAYMAIPVTQDRFVAQLPGGGSPSLAGFPSNPTNIPLSVEQVDFEVPVRAFISLGGSHWSFQFGRDKLAWGNGVFGNLLLAPNPDYYDFLRFTTYWQNFKFSADYIDLPPYWAGQSSILGQTTQSGGNAAYTGGNLPLLASKLFLNHRIEFRLWDRATLALSEEMILGGTDPTLTYWNPLMIFHDWNVWQVANDIASIELSVNPYKWLTLYGQFASNKVGGSVEVYSGAGNTPSAYAYLGGAIGDFPLGEGFLETATQITRTDPWFYIGGSPDYGPEPWLTFEMDRKYLSNFLGADPIVSSPTGWLYGPDSLVWNLKATYHLYGKYAVGASLRIQRQGSNTLDTAYYSGPGAVALSTPSGPNPTDTQLLRLFGSWNIGRYLGIDVAVGGGVDLIWVQNVNHVAGDNIFNTQISEQVSLTF